MLKIGICDDEAFWSGKLKTVVSNYLTKINIIYEIKCFSSGEELLESGFQGVEMNETAFYPFELLFLDIEMEGIDGLETAKEIKHRDSNIEIVFLTSHDELVKRAFIVRAFRFLDKSTYMEEIEECIQAYLREKEERKKIIVRTLDGEIRISLRDIWWIEAEHNGSIVWGENWELRCRHSLDEWEQRLDNMIFFRNHRRYIVNFRWVERIEDKVYMLKNYKLEIAKRRKAILKERYMEYLFLHKKG